MVKMESTVTIARPVEEVFRVFLDLDTNARTTQTNLGTTVTVRLNPNPIGLLKLLSPVFARIGERVWDKRLARLKHALERSPESQLIDHTRPAAR